MNLTDKINALAKLGEILGNPDDTKFHSFRNEIGALNSLISTHQNSNGWFTPDQVGYAIAAAGKSLQQGKIEKWLHKYPLATFENKNPRTIGVVMAGNIPMVGLHDYLSVLITGNKFLGKQSSGDDQLLPLMHRIIEKIEPGFKGKAEFTDGRLKDFDAIIATGSNNSARYFEYYFGKYPHIIRKNRNGIAVISETESPEQLHELGNDIFRYFGLGCRNVSKIYIPEDFQMATFFEAIESYSPVIDHHKYKNNYDYNKSILLINKVAHFDNGFLLLTESSALASPVSVLHYEKYRDIAQVNQDLQNHSQQIQCVVSDSKQISHAIAPGTSQTPPLWNYADAVDTIEFLRNLK